MEHIKVGVCLSGGGHRATAWSLGALLYLSEAKVAPQVRSIASVSGGSITNGFVAVKCDFPRTTAEQFAERVVAPLASRVAAHGTVFGDRSAAGMKAGVIGLGAAFGILALLAIIGPIVTLALRPCERSMLCAIPGLVSIGCVIALGLLLAALRTRGSISRDGYDRTLYEGSLLRQLERTVEHVFCTTDVQFAEHVYWAPKFVYAYRLGVGSPGDIRVADVVATSAAFPGAFPPFIARTETYRFEHGANELPQQLVLLDGGIYDNMGDQWFSGLPKRLGGDDGSRFAKERAASLRKVVELQGSPETVIVVNAGEAFPMSELRRRWWPAVEFEVLLRTMSALGDNANSLRRSRLVDRFNHTGRRTPLDTGRHESLARGTLVHISTNPDASARKAAANASVDPGRAASARELLGTRLGPNDTVVDWEALTDSNKNIATTLDPLGEETVANLMQHAYVLAAVQCHMFLGRALPDRGDWIERCGYARFLRLARGQT